MSERRESPAILHGRVCHVLAEQKNLPLDLLQRLGVRDLDKGAIGIPYFGETGEELFERRRNPPEVKPRFKQPDGVKLRPYGLDRLEAARKAARLYLCEGESDAWTLWHCELPALALPGAGAAKALESDHLDGLADVFLLPDNDAAGKQFVEGIRHRLAELGHDGRHWRVHIPEQHKDVSDWYAAVGIADFREALKAAAADAELLHVEVVPSWSSSIRSWPTSTAS